MSSALYAGPLFASLDLVVDDMAQLDLLACALLNAAHLEFIARNVPPARFTSPQLRAAFGVFARFADLHSTPIKLLELFGELQRTGLMSEEAALELTLLLFNFTEHLRPGDFARALEEVFRGGI